MKLIYVMDPYCGWCYGNSANLEKAHQKYKDEMEFDILPGGMFTGENVKTQNPQLTSFLVGADPQVTEMTGIQFGQAYLRFRAVDGIILDSEIPSRAMVTVKEMDAAHYFQFALEVQRARYLHGKDLNVDATYVEICKALAVDEIAFLEKFHSDEMRLKTQETFQYASQFAKSFPTMVGEKDGNYYLLEKGALTEIELLRNIETFRRL